MSVPVYRRGPRQVYGQRKARGWIGSRAVVAGASLLPRRRTPRRRPPPQLHARLPRRLIRGAPLEFPGLPVPYAEAVDTVSIGAGMDTSSEAEARDTVLVGVGTDTFAEATARDTTTVGVAG